MTDDTSQTTRKQLRAKGKRLAIVWWGVALGLVIGCALNPISGYDWVNFYYPRGHIFAPEWVVNPLWIYFVLAPIAYLPTRVGYVILSLINVSIIWLGSQLTGVNRFALLLSFPALWVLWYGQIDGFVMLGVTLGLWAVQRHKSVLLGFALLLLLVKPHIGGPLAVLYFLWARNWRVLVTFGIVLLLSMIVWRFDWPAIWVKTLLQIATPPPDATMTTAAQRTNISLYPYGLLSWLVVVLPMPRAERAISVVAATFLSMPYTATYSLIALLVLPVPWWAYLLSSTPLILGPDGYWVTTFVPLGCLGWIAAKRLLIIAKDRASGWTADVTDG